MRKVDYATVSLIPFWSRRDVGYRFLLGQSILINFNHEAESDAENL